MARHDACSADTADPDKDERGGREISKQGDIEQKQRSKGGASNDRDQRNDGDDGKTGNKTNPRAGRAREGEEGEQRGVSVEEPGQQQATKSKREHGPQQQQEGSPDTQKDTAQEGRDGAGHEQQGRAMHISVRIMMGQGRALQHGVG